MPTAPRIISPMQHTWLFYALLSAAAAALIPIFAKLGMKDIDSNLATTVRSLVMTLFLITVCLWSGLANQLKTIHTKAMTMILLSGLAGALSWLFYFRAIKIGQVSQVAPIDKLSMPLGILLAVHVLGERPTVINWLGIALIAGGAYLATMKG